MRQVGLLGSCLRGSRTTNSKNKDEMQGFFPFGKLRVRMTNIYS